MQTYALQVAGKQEAGNKQECEVGQASRQHTIIPAQAPRERCEQRYEAALKVGLVAGFTLFSELRRGNRSFCLSTNNKGQGSEEGAPLDLPLGNI